MLFRSTNSADLVYIGQSGAMNEALADYFGNAVDVDVTGTDMADPDAGLLGEDLCRTTSPAECALRDLNDGRTTIDSAGIDGRRGAVLTLATVTGTQTTAEELAGRYPDAHAEAMEGFGVATAAKLCGVPFAEIRTISNIVGPRDKDGWRLQEAFAALTKAVGGLA